MQTCYAYWGDEYSYHVLFLNFLAFHRGVEICNGRGEMEINCFHFHVLVSSFSALMKEETWGRSWGNGDV